MALEVVGYAALQVIPSVRGARGTLEAQMNPEARRAGARSGQAMGVGLMAGAKRYVKLAGGIMAAYGIAKGIKGGWDRALNIDAAQAKLRGLGHDAGTVSAIMDSANKSVIGTAYGLDAAATSAATAVAAGIAPGRDLTRYLSLTADAATIAGSSMGEMGDIFGKVQTGQRVYTRELNQLANRGIPIYQYLQDELGVTAEELRKMVAAGQVDATTFYKVIEDNIGGAAKQSGESMRGMLANTGAAFSRFGANIISRAFPAIKNGLGGLISIVDSIGGAIDPVADAIEALFSAGGGGGGSAMAGVATGLSNALTTVRTAAADLAPVVMGVFRDIRDAAGPVFENIANVVGGKLLPAFNRFLPVITPIAGFLLGVFGTAIVEAFKGIGQVITGVLTVVSGVMDVITGVFTGNWSLAWDGIKNIVSGAFGTIVGLIRTYLAVGILRLFSLGFSLIRGVVTAGWAGIRGLFSAGIRGLDRLVRGLVNIITAPYRIAFTTARNFVTTGWRYITGQFSGGVGGIRGVMSRVLEVVTYPFRRAVDSARNIVTTGFDRVRTAASNGVGGVRRAVSSAWSGITGVVQRPMGTVLRGFNTFLGRIDTVMGKVSAGRLGLSHRIAVPAGWRAGGYTGNIHPDRVAGVVHGDEHVIRSESRRRIERANPGLLDHMNRHGSVPTDAGYRDGGRVWPVKGSRAWTTYRGHTGIDFARPGGTPVYAAHDGRVTATPRLATSYGWHVRQQGAGGESIYAHLSRIVATVGQMLNAGQLLGNVGTTGNSTGNHLHYERRPPGTDTGTAAWLRGAGEPSGGGGFASRFFSGAKNLLGGLPSFDEIFDGLQSAMNVGGIIGDLAKTFPGTIRSGVTDWLKDKISPFDRGGVANGTGWMHKDTIQPERVLSPAESAAFQRWMDRGTPDGAGGPIDLSDDSIDRLVAALAPALAQAMAVAMTQGMAQANRAAAGTRQTEGTRW